jgi:hypothetical protein
MLYNLPTIGDKDWYRWGTEILLHSQTSSGEWVTMSVSTKGAPMGYYGPALNTAFALLFLKRSHPMKDLTSKIPYDAKELNEGIARLQKNQRASDRSVTDPSAGKNPDSQSKPRNP